MCAPVSSEFILPVEASAAKLASKRPFPGVDHHVPREVVLLRKASSTNVAVKRPLTAVGSHVVQELAAVAESCGLGAYAARGWE